MHAFWNSRTKKAVALAAVLALLCPLFLYDADAATLEALSLDANGINSHPILQAGTQGIPDFVPQEQIHQYGHIQRLPALEEGANTLAFLNTDGTVSIYYTSQPLRYTDSAGILRDIDLSLTLENDSYRTVSNAVSMSFARDYRNGISLAYDSDTLRLIAIPPVSTLPGQMDTAEMVTAEATDSILTYRNLFGSGLDVRYTPLYNGIKEDIILAEYTGISEFQFLLYTGGLAVFEDGGRYYAAQSQDAQTRYQIGDVVAYDAQGHISEGTLTVTPVKAGQIYQLTITVDEAFLTGEETAYPVLIDPEITVSDNALGAGAVEDCPVYSGKPNANFGSFQYNGIGYMDSTYQIGRTAVKLSGLISHSTFNELPAAAITSAVFYIKDSSGASGRTIDLYPLTSNPAWTESTLTWNNIGSATVTPLTSATVGGGAQSAFDITALVKHWKSETYDINCGFLLRNANETLSGNFYSTETAVANQPYAVITYNYAGANFSNAINISLNTVYSVSLSTYGERKYFKFTPSATGFYTYESLQRSAGDPSARLYNPNYKQLSYANDSGSDYNFQITYHLIAGQTYYFSAEGYLSSTSNYSIRIRSETSAAQIGASAIAFGSSTNVSTSLPYQAVCFSFTPSETKGYLFFSAASSGDPRIWMYDSSLTLQDNDNSSAYNSNFRLNKLLTANQTYYFVATHSGASTGSYTLHNMGVTATISGVHYIKNVGTGKYMDVEGPANLGKVQQWKFSTAEQKKWTVEKQPSGFFTLRTEFGSKNYAGNSTTSTGESNVSLYSSSANQSNWMIYTDGTCYLFEPRTAPGKLLCAPATGGDGTDLQLTAMGAYGDHASWVLFEEEVTAVALEVVYDNAYINRFSNYLERINSHLVALQEFYLTKLGIGITCSTPAHFRSLGDDCSTDPTQVCTHYPDSDCFNASEGYPFRKHHKNIYNILDDIDPPGSAYDLKLAFIGHTTCSKDALANVHSLAGIRGVADLVSKVAVVVRFESLDGELKTIIHEIGHFFGAPDHYGEGGGSVPSTEEMNEGLDPEIYSRNCLYGEDRDQLYGDALLTICTGCRETILSNLT